MQFLVTGYDGKDPGAPERREKAREKHLAGVKRLVISGNHLYAAAILSESGAMAGSVMIVEFPSLEALKADWLDTEPYVTQKVWETVDIQPCRVPEFFFDRRLLYS